MAIPIIGDIINSVKDVVSEVVVDKDKRDQVNLELRRIEDQAQARLDEHVSNQIEVNKVEAASSSVFVAGWRPAVGWIGAAGLGWTVLLQPMVSWTASVVFRYEGAFPVVNSDILLYTLGGMLGIGGMRTFEKYKGVATNDYSVQPKTTGATAVEVKPTGEITIEKTGAAVVATPVQKPKKKFKIF